MLIAPDDLGNGLLSAITGQYGSVIKNHVQDIREMIVDATTQATKCASLRSRDNTVDRLIAIATSGLPQMYCEDSQRFVHTCRRSAAGTLQRVGQSVRYGAIVTLGARHLPEDVQRKIFSGQSALEFCGRMLGEIHSVQNLGDVALITWAAAELQHPQLDDAIRRLREMSGAVCQCYTVEAAWIVSALTAAANHTDVDDDLCKASRRLFHCFRSRAGVFAHHSDRSNTLRGRSHVASFADQVYSIQAFAKYYRVAGDAQALETAGQCAEQICAVQGAAGQWWWHYDARTGGVVEEYPVYSVHQNSMGPMALLELREAGGPSFDEAVQRGLRWLTNPPEIERSLIDDERFVIWRKIARAEPRKATRAIRAATTRVHPKFRMQWLDRVFRPTVIDFECRPYHLGWILYTWLRRREY